MVDKHMQNVHMRTFFYPNACNVCHIFGKNVHLLRCSWCKMMVYCGNEHQNQHWPMHREICRVIQYLAAAYRNIYGGHEDRESPGKWLVCKTNLISTIEAGLGRSVTDAEFQMLHAPRSCEICHETTSRELRNCDVCPYASFCLKHPKDSRHEEKCKTSLIAFEIACVNYRPDDYFECDNYGEGIPKDMKEAVALYESTYRFDKMFKLKGFWDIMLSAQISRVYTFLFTLEKLSLPASPKMIVHVVGANLAEMVTAYYWRRVLHHLEYLQDLQIVCIGPEIQEDWNIMHPTLHYEVGQRKLRVLFVPGYYTASPYSPHWTNPDCIIGFNLGMYGGDLAVPHWESSLRSIAALGCPFAWTSSCALESDFDREKISKIFGPRVQPSWSGRNPFSSWQPIRNVVLDGFFYHNYYLNIYEKLC